VSPGSSAAVPGGAAAEHGGTAAHPGPIRFHSLSPREAAQALATDAASGLSPSEALDRLREHGPNELPEKPPASFLSLLVAQFRDFLVILLVGAAVVSVFLGEWLDAAVIILLVILNAVIGVVQESKADRALAALRKMAAPEARVIRGGSSVLVPARTLVPGDLVVLEAGSSVPADLRLTEAVNLQLQEASLTGESAPVEKDVVRPLKGETPVADQATMAWMGTTATCGRGRGLVTATGRATQIGLIAAMLEEEVDETTPLQRKLTEVGRWLGIAALAICSVVFVVGILGGRDILTMFLTSVSLAIAAVPEGLPAIVTVCLALGMREMVRRHALIRRLTAVETLGSATVICTDKTGTLTQNEMTAEVLWVDGGRFLELPRDERMELGDDGSTRFLLEAGLLASDARWEPASGASAAHAIGDPTEVALVIAAAKAGLVREQEEARLPRIAEIPFDSDRKRMSTVHRVSPGPGAALAAGPGPFVLFVKGAPDLLLDRCTRIRAGEADEPLDDPRRAAATAAGAQLASRALRVIGVAYRPLQVVPPPMSPADTETDLTFVGLVGMRDPARPEAAPAVDLAHRAGIRVIMATGDYAQTAAAIARDVGLLGPGGSVLSGPEIDVLDDEQLTRVLETTSVFARVSPQHKVRIVDCLRREGHVVGMTGDGVNDAPALKRADIGIAMGISGTDVTRETADMVLTDDNFASIISAVEQGRIIFSNIRKFVSFLLTCNVGEIGTIFVATLLGWPLPLTAIQLLWMNLLTDGAPALALGMEKEEPGIMGRPPRPTSRPIIDRSMAAGLVVQGITITTASLLAFWTGWTVYGSEAVARTMAFVTLSLCQVLRAYTGRSERSSLFSIGVFSNRWMQYAALSSIALILVVLYVPGLDTVFNAVGLTAGQWARIGPLLLLPAVVEEITKAVLRAADRARAGRDARQRAGRRA
jgi:P-type Ca2+ transporter type 2C